MNSATLPLLSSPTTCARLAWWQGQPISRNVFLAQVNQVAKNLPQRRFAINLCDDRYLFMVAFAAVSVTGQTNLLPASRVNRDIQDTLAAYPDSYCLLDHDINGWIKDGNLGHESMVPEIAFDQEVVIVFTSGSTGRAQPNPKRWGDLVKGAQLAQCRFGFGEEAGTTLVATVPPQHMYGLETSIMIPLVTETSIHSGRPFFPEAICATLAGVPAPRILITTPIHLRVCAKADLRWPPLAFIVSATAPLSKTLAAQTEQVFGTRVLEIYGCTEAGSLASRRTVTDEFWRLYDGLRISEGCVHGTHLPAPVRLNDIVEPHGDNEFKLLGRREDLVNIAGKRASLSHLNHTLNDIEGIVDGVFIMLDDREDRTIRLTALVVAPEVSEQRILAALAERIDPVFLPRPLYKVERLPRNETGKLPRDALLRLVNALKKSPGKSG